MPPEKKNENSTHTNKLYISSYTTDVYDKPFYFIVATKMNFYSCNLIMEHRGKERTRDSHFTYVRIACPFHQLSVDDYSYVRFVIIYIYMKMFFPAVRSFIRLLFDFFAHTLSFVPFSVFVLLLLDEYVYSYIYMSLFVCSLLCWDSFFFFGNNPNKRAKAEREY